jgi:hypothetical protein
MLKPLTRIALVALEVRKASSQTMLLTSPTAEWLIGALALCAARAAMKAVASVLRSIVMIIEVRILCRFANQRTGVVS